MGIPAGLSNFTSSFMQAYQSTKDKQDQDARQASQDEMNKQQFNLQQQARQLDINNAIKTGQEHDTDRQRALGIQQQGDLDAQSLRTVIGAYANKDYQTALKGIEDHIARDPNAPGKFVFDRDGMGNITLSEGKASGKYIGADGKVIRSVTETPDNFVAGFNARVNPSGYLAGQAETAKENRKMANDILLAQAKSQADMAKEAFIQGQENSRNASKNLTSLRVAGLKGSPEDDVPDAAMIVARLKPIYPNVKDAKQAASILRSLQSNPKMFEDDYINYQKTLSANQGHVFQPAEKELLRKEARTLAAQIGILPPDQPTPDAATPDGTVLPPMPEPWIPRSQTVARPGITKPKPSVSAGNSKAIVDSVLGGM